jgi:hypothetical protein
MATQIPPTPPDAKASRKSPLLWILGGCLVLIVIGIIITFSTGIFVARKAGLDPGLMEKNPALAMAKIMASINPDIEVLSVDEDRGLIQVREKKTGKALMMDFKEAQKGRIVFLDEKGNKVEIRSQGGGENATVDIKSSEGSMHIGAGAESRLPEWLPSYPGAQSTGTFSFNAEKGDSGSCAFKTSDSLEKVAAFYEDALKNAGFEIQKSTMQAPGQGSMIHLSASDGRNNRTALVTMARSDQETTINLVYETKQ